MNCYETRSEAASARYYRYKRNGNFTESPLPEASADAAVVPEVSEDTKDDLAVPAVISEEKTEEKKE